MLLLSLLLACNQDDKIPLGDSGETSSENTDSEDTSGTSTVPEGTQVVFDLTGEWGGTTVSLTSFSTAADGSMSFGEQFGSASAETSVPFYLPEPTEFVTSPDDPSVSYALVGATLHHDDDGDGYPSGFETISGIGRYWLLYWRGPVNPDLAKLGVVEGWNAYDPNAQEIGDLSGVPLDANLVPHDEISVAGGYDGAEDLSTLGVLLYPEALSAHQVAGLTYDGPMGDPWSISLTEAPDSDHIFDADGTDLAVELPVVYADLNGSGGYDEGEPPLYNACLENGDSVALIYLPELTSMETAMGLSGQGITPGWLAGAFDVNNQLTILKGAELLSLRLCPYAQAN
jgi:hypothetical protein